MNIPAQIQSFHFADKTVNAYVPSIEWIQQQYETGENITTVPYWAQVWPAAKALCEVITSTPALVKDKQVLEIAAGLALPSLLAAQFAKQVIATDYIPAAVDMIKRSAEYNQLENIQCRIIDWNKLDKKLEADVLLLSDINYEPKSFDVLYKLLHHFIQRGTTVLLSTPQRLLAKPFMHRIEQWQTLVHNIEIKQGHENIFTTVWILQLQ